MTVRRYPVLAFVVVLASAMTASSVFACSCSGPTPVLEELERSDAVFAGTVFDVEDRLWFGRYAWLWIRSLFSDAFDNERYEFETGFAFTFALSEVFKGDRAETAKVFTGRGGGDCGYRFEKGSEYLVYAYKSRDGFLITSICRRTKFFRAADEEVSELRRLTSVALGTPPPNNSLERTAGLRPSAAELMIR